MSEKLKVLMLSDHPLVPSGVGTQSKYLIEGLLRTGKYKFICAGGAIQHPDYTPQRVAPELFGEDWTIFPVNGYGDKTFVRQMLQREKPDVLLMFTDPRFFVWVWEMEDEIRSVCPIVYWHVWDNDPTPTYNKTFYESTDRVVALSLKTFGLLQDMDYARRSYIPHALPPDLFKPLPEEENAKFKHDHMGPHRDKKFIVFWNNRNARRKQTGDVIGSFAKFAEQVGRDNVALMMHTAPDDPEGQDLLAVAKVFGIDENMIISAQRVDPATLNHYYNLCDVTINIASNEGFGLGTLESMYAGTPIIVHFTGGLQFQIGDWWEGRTDFTDQDEMTKLAKRNYKAGKGNWWGVPVFPASRSCTGSQQIPYIYDDRVSHEETVAALVKVYRMSRKDRRALGAKARDWAVKTFNLADMITSWDSVLSEQILTHRQAGVVRHRVTRI